MSKGVDDLPIISFTEEDIASGRLAVKQRNFAMAHGPIFKRVMSSEPDSKPGIFLVGPEANRFVFHTGREYFSHEQGWTPIIGHIMGRGLLNMDDPEHEIHRKMWNPGFTLASMETYLPVILQVITKRTQTWVSRGEMDVCAEMRAIAFDVAAAALAGSQLGSWVDRLRELFAQLLQPYNEKKETVITYGERCQRALRGLNQMLLKLIAERRRMPPGEHARDVVGMIVQARDEKGAALSDQQLLGHLKILFVAGHETTMTLGSWVLFHLAKQDATRHRVEAELKSLMQNSPDEISVDVLRASKTLENFIKETGRLFPPVLNLPRGSLKEFEFGGYRIPSGMPVRLALAAGHRLPEVFANPDQFDLDRFAPPRDEEKRVPYGLITFGGGARTCLGINFAQLEVKALAAHVLQNFQIEMVEGSNPIHAGLWIAQLSGMRMRVRARATPLGA